jgi:Dynein heavy chain, N-terminal region 2
MEVFDKSYIQGKIFLIAEQLSSNFIQQTSSALEALIAAGIHSRLLLATKMLTQIEASLEIFFDNRRMAFPRLYFLSIKEVIEMWAAVRSFLHFRQIHIIEFQADDLKTLNGFATRLFPGIAEFVFCKSADGTISVKSVKDRGQDSLNFDNVTGSKPTANIY